MTLTKASEIHTKYQKQLLAGLIPAGTLTVIAGSGGIGKTTWLLKQIALASRGLLDGDYRGTPIDTLIASNEDDWPTQMVPRLKAAGADLDRVHKVDIQDWQQDALVAMDTPSFPQDTARLQAMIQESGASLVMIDALDSLLAGDMNKTADARRALDALGQTANATGAAVVLIDHFRKGSGNVSDKLSGSHAKRDRVRSMLAIVIDPDTEDRILTVDKSNYGPYQGQSYRFALEEVSVQLDDGTTSKFPVASDMTESSVSVSDVINRDPDSEIDPPNEIDDWLTNYLSEQGGEAAASDVYRYGGAAGGFSKDQLKRSKRRLHITGTQRSNGPGHSHHVWQLALDDAEPSGSRELREHWEHSEQTALQMLPDPAITDRPSESTPQSTLLNALPALDALPDHKTQRTPTPLDVFGKHPKSQQ